MWTQMYFYIKHSVDLDFIIKFTPNADVGDNQLIIQNLTLVDFIGQK